MSPIKTRVQDGILQVTLDRPKANAIDLKTSKIMGNTFKNFRDDPNLKVAIITGAGEKFFCPGWDLKAAADGDAVDGDYGIGGFGGLQHCLIPSPKHILIDKDEEGNLTHELFSEEQKSEDLLKILGYNE